MIIREPDSDSGQWFNSGKARCNECGLRFSFSAADMEDHQADEERVAPVTAVVYTPVRCPVCRSKNTHVHTTKPRDDASGYRIRYHACNNCHVNFKSVEKDE
jgi:DNA-directed RNA polymerase subunit RPC12/RpoP